MTDRLRFAPRVTRRHGTIFVETWAASLMDNGDALDAFDAAGVIDWPDAGAWESPAQDRFHVLADEIVTDTFAEAQEAIAAAFVKVSRRVLARERRRQRRGGRR